MTVNKLIEKEESLQNQVENIIACVLHQNYIFIPNTLFGSNIYLLSEHKQLS